MLLVSSRFWISEVCLYKEGASQRLNRKFISVSGNLNNEQLSLVTVLFYNNVIRYIAYES